MDESIDRAYTELDKQMLLAYTELDKRMLLASTIFDQHRREILSSGIAFGYFTALLAYGFYNPPQLGTWVAGLYVLQFVIVGFWIVMLLSGGMTEQIIVLSLMTLFVLFVFTHSGAARGRVFVGHTYPIKKYL